MTTNFSALPIIDLSILTLSGASLNPDDATKLGEQLYDAFATTGFAYLVNAPLTFSHEDVFRLSGKFFGLPNEEKMKLAKKTFRPTNKNTYRGYFPTQPLVASDNLKEGFEMGPKALNVMASLDSSTKRPRFDFAESNVWPEAHIFPGRLELEQLYDELQALASVLLTLLATSLGKPLEFFAHYLADSVSTLRLLHYPRVEPDLDNRSSSSLDSISTYGSTGSSSMVKLSCTPHTDSGILTLLHQDSNGGLEVRNAAQEWVAAPYIPESIVVNIGDLMAEVSGGRFVATMHRVRAPLYKNYDERADTPGEKQGQDFGRFSIPFFFEPGEHCVVRSVDDDTGAGILYGEHVRQKMKDWVEFKDDDEDDVDDED